MISPRGLRRSFQDLIDASPSIVSVVDTDDWTVLYQTQAGNKTLGNIVGRSCHKNIAGLDDICGFCRAHEAIKEKRTTTAEVERPDGQAKQAGRNRVTAE